MTAAELKQTVKRTDDAPVKPLSQPKRADRLTRQKGRLAGIRIERPTEPADRLVDLAADAHSIESTFTNTGGAGLANVRC